MWELLETLLIIIKINKGEHFPAELILIGVRNRQLNSENKEGKNLVGSGSLLRWAVT